MKGGGERGQEGVCVQVKLDLLKTSTKTLLTLPFVEFHLCLHFLHRSKDLRKIEKSVIEIYFKDNWMNSWSYGYIFIVQMFHSILDQFIQLLNNGTLHFPFLWLYLRLHISISISKSFIWSFHLYICKFIEKTSNISQRLKQLEQVPFIWIYYCSYRNVNLFKILSVDIVVSNVLCSQ